MKSAKQVLATEVLWLTWEKQVRNRNLAERLGAHLVELDEPGGRLRRYAVCIAKTVRLLAQWRGRLVVVQNPSMVLALLAVLLKPLLGLRVVVDAHNAGVHPSGRLQALLEWLVGFITRRADWTIVTNDNLAAHVAMLGGRPLVLPDPLPRNVGRRDGPMQVAPGLPRKIMFICTWAADEPYCEVIAAAALLPADVTLYITGSSKGRERRCGADLPANIELTGYLPDDEYHRLLLDSHVVIDLTTRENCLVCGAYEAVAAGTPFVLSSTEALRSYFRAGGVHADNNAQAIADAIQTVLNDYARFERDVTEFRSILESEWTERFGVVRQVLARAGFRD